LVNEYYRYDLVLTKVRQYAERNGLKVRDDFTSRFKEYCEFLVHSSTEIQKFVGFEIRPGDFTFALWSIGLSAASLAIGARSDKLTRENLDEAITRAKEGISVEARRELVGLCPHPTCWQAASSMIKIGSELFDNRSRLMRE